MLPVASNAKKMTPELIDYIITYYLNLFTDKEKAAYKHYHTLLKHEDSEPLVRNAILKHWGTNDKETLKFLDSGYESFKSIVAERIFKERLNELVINNCPNCNRLARTPNAKQCRFCGFDWHVKKTE